MIPNELSSEECHPATDRSRWRDLQPNTRQWQGNPSEGGGEIYIYYTVSTNFRTYVVNNNSGFICQVDVEFEQIKQNEKGNVHFSD